MTSSAFNAGRDDKAAIIGNRHKKPSTLPIDPDAIPDDLKSFDRWLAWQWQWHEKSAGGKGSYTKVPFNARTGKLGSSTDPATWSSFDDALEGARAGRYDGIGFALGEADGGLNFAGIDLDDCRNPESGELSALACDIIETMQTYCEVSPSGTGVKLFCIGKLPAGARTRNKAGTVEIYSGGRYFTVTGQRYEEAPHARVEARQEELIAVWQRYIGTEQDIPAAQQTGSTPTNGAAIEVSATQAALGAMLRIRPKVNENDGSDRLFTISCRAVEHDLSDEAAIAAIREYEQQYPFPRKYSDDEILTRLRDAAKHVERGVALKSQSRHTTDYGNAERFASQHGADVRFCHKWGKWLVWDGKRWAIDNSGEVMRRAKQTARSILKEAMQLGDSEQCEARCKWALASEKCDRLNASIRLAESEPLIPIAVEVLDAKPWLFNCENGTIDLHTGELREHRREDYLTKLCPLEYPREAVCPELWLKFLDEIFAGNTRLIQYIKRLMGMSLVGEVIEHILPICYGPGGNGKGVLIETWLGVLGPDYAMKAPHGLLMVAKHDKHPTELADMHGKRVVAVVESEGRLSESLVKETTGGDTIRARRMREDFWQFQPSHTFVLATNCKPTIQGTDNGIWRRVQLIPFMVTIPEAEQDKQLRNKLRAEYPAILRWAVEGCLDWQQHGLQPPEEVLDATTAYRTEQDVLGQFLGERCDEGPEYEVGATDLYGAYKCWAVVRGEYEESQSKFGRRIGERGFAKGRDTKNLVIYKRLRLKSEGKCQYE